MRRLSLLPKLLSSDQLSSVASDHQLFVGGNDPNLHLGIGGGDQSFLTADIVLLGVDLDAQVAQVLTDVSTGGDAVLANTGGEGQHIDAVQSSCVSANVLSDFVAELLTSQSASLVAVLCAVFQITEVGGNTGEERTKKGTLQAEDL